MNEITISFSKNLKRLRCNMGLTQKRLADMLGYSEKSVSKWESGSVVAPGFILPTIAKILDCSIDDLFSNVQQVEYYLGIDGGGTKTEFVLADKGGNILDRFLLGASNPVDIGIDSCLNVLKEGITRIAGKVPVSNVSVFAGIAGGITGNNRALIHSFLEKFGFAAVDNNSDAMNAVSAGLGLDDGIAVIIGTGSIAYTKVGNETFRTGGFGYLLEEGGSGFCIGRDAVIAALKYEEGSGKKTVLYDKHLNKCSVSNLLSNVSQFYRGGKRELASYTKLVFEAYSEGDDVAISIIEKNMRVVAEIISDAAKKLIQKNKLRLYSSAVFRKITILFSRLSKKV